MRGKVGIFLPGRNGDIMQAMSVLKYKDTLWPDKDIIWFCGNTPFRDVLNHNDAIAEIRHWPEGWKLPQRCEDENAKAALGELPWADLSVLVGPDNRLDGVRKHMFEFTKDLDEGYFPAPWMMSQKQRHWTDYPNVSRKVFRVNAAWEWHPYLGFTDEEREQVKIFCSKLPHAKTVMLETESCSGPSPWNDDLTRETMEICRKKLGSCNFIFASINDNSKFLNESEGVVSASCFTIRQTALINNHIDLFIGVSSGISQAVNCWGNKPTPKLQYCGSFIMSSVSIANGPMELVVTDPPGSNSPEHELKYPPNRNHREVFKAKLSSILETL